jgi:hypothetical protein
MSSATNYDRIATHDLHLSAYLIATRIELVHER